MIRYIGIVFLGLILWLFFQKQDKDYATLLTLTICLLSAGYACKAIAPVLDFVKQLEQTAQLQEGVLEVLLKVTGIAMITEMAGMICSDAGNGALQKTIRMLGSTTMLAMSVPVFQALLSLIQEILSKV